ncbi:uncharacterized protein BO97DRAFT_422137 [Aspergillus homomorphus CBS 101889]|uniref:Amine oxidase domain-containing protein n=1 Tax=Aspergillus homomorphus (strain CBS 101889) TaxID=1450537 RepID=A0A395I5H4_ASPHC|nr:hypothetical protein BO97DRAFT_422137 [Aspergillus homomorphus CBS 101889]RAL14783.1 hypothetical protein BO97DRAFT_422137 [Aspergillus homomorphus CBS 101889]
MLEARDRIGGRTYTVEEDGLLWEMGGTWGTQHMAYLFKKLTRYKMNRDLMLTHSREYENDYYTLHVPGATSRKLTHEEGGQIVVRAWDIFVNVDGQNCCRVCFHCRTPSWATSSCRGKKWSGYRISCRGRFDDIKHLLSVEEAEVLVALLLHIWGGSLETSSLWDMVRSHALMSFSAENFTPVWTTFKLREGLRIAVRAIDDRGSLVQVTAASGSIHQARRVISTIPLNVLHSIRVQSSSLPDPPASNQYRPCELHDQDSCRGIRPWSGLVYDADEIFMCTTAGGIMSITTLDGQLVKDGKVRLITKKIWDGYWAIHYDPAFSFAITNQDEKSNSSL